MVIQQIPMTPDQLFFAIFCIEALADEFHTTGDNIYLMLVEGSGILDDYIVPYFDTLHTQGKEYIIIELKELMQKHGVLK